MNSWLMTDHRKSLFQHVLEQTWDVHFTRTPSTGLFDEGQNWALIDKTASLSERTQLSNPCFIYRLLLTLIVISNVCIYSMVLANFNHHTYTCK